MVLKIFHIILRLILGGMLAYGGMAKFSKPVPEPAQMIKQVEEGADLTSDTAVLKIKNYIFGMKQTGYFWTFLGIAEFLAGILLLSQVFGVIGAIVALPLTLNIFLFHLFLKPDDVPGLLETLGLLAINLWLIAVAYPKWKPLLIDRKIW